MFTTPTIKRQMQGFKHCANAFVFALLILTPSYGQKQIEITSTEKANGLQWVHITSDAYEFAALAMQWTFNAALEVERTGTGEAWARTLSAQWASDTVGTGLRLTWDVTPKGFRAEGDAATVDEWGALMLNGLRTLSTSNWKSIQSEWIEEWNSSYHTPNMIAQRVLNSELFSLRHPNGERELPETLAAISESDIQRHGAAYWHPNNGILVLASPSELEHIPKEWMEFLADWPTRELQKPAIYQPIRPNQHEGFIIGIAADSVLALAGHLVRLKPDHPDVLPLLILSEHIDAITSGSFEILLDPLMSSIRFTTSGTASSAVTAIRALEKSMVTLTQSAPTSEALEAWKIYAREQTTATLQSPETAVHLFMERPSWFQAAADTTWNAFTASVNPNDIQRVAINYLRPSTLSIAAVGQIDSARNVVSAFADQKYIKRYTENAVLMSPYGPVPNGLEAEDIFREYYGARGGEEAFGALKSCRWKGSMKAGGTMVMNVTSEEIYGIGHRSAISIDGQVMMEQIIRPGQGQSIQMGQLRAMPLEEYQRYESKLYAADLLALEQRNISADLVGTYQHPSGQQWVIELSRDDALVQRIFFDANTSLLVRIEEQRFGPTGPIEVLIEYSDYKIYDGIRYPTKITRETNNQRMITTIDEVQPNARISKNQFEWE